MAAFNLTGFINANQNYILVGVALVGIFIIYEFFWKGGAKPPKPVDRSEVERKKFVERNKLNESSWGWLMRGNHILGKILMMMETNFKNPEEHQILELVLKPPLFKRFTFVNPLSKEICIQLDVKNTDYDNANPTKFLNVFPGVTFSNVFGIFYDRTIEPTLEEHIKNDSVFRTDLENFAAIYYAKSQEQATFDPQHAHEILKEQIKLEIEKEKRAKTTEGT